MELAWVLVLLAVILTLVIDFRRRALKGDLQEAAERERREIGRRVELEAQLAGAERELRSLSRFREVVDAEAKAQSILSEAKSQASQIETDARVYASLAMERVRLETERLTSESRVEQQKAERVVGKAEEDAREILARARAESTAIAGEAKETVKEAARLQETLTALRNRIEGYGDQYIVPVHGLLDELGKDLDFKEAGQKLIKARERTRKMVRSRTAAKCDYVEENRKDTAIAFVTDAFNGKVDSALADVSHENFGTLEREIKDAFYLVNQNGAAFRNARITEEYLDARLDELRWAVVARELKFKEREEQRALKEKIREEERAQREFERAMKDAQKEEELIRKAMEKARKEVERASNDQKALYEDRLLQLTEQLRQAEAKNQRALSMAQQTRSGHVYVISNVGSFGENIYKIGLTRRLEPRDRIRELGDASVPFDFDVHALIPSADAPALEHALHKQFVRCQVNKVNPRKEFFKVRLEEIRQGVQKVGAEAQWTMTAECRDYKETMALEKALKDRSINEKVWVDQQVKEHDAAMTQAVAAEVEG